MIFQPVVFRVWHLVGEYQHFGSTSCFNFRSRRA